MFVSVESRKDLFDEKIQYSIIRLLAKLIPLDAGLLIIVRLAWHSPRVGFIYNHSYCSNFPPTSKMLYRFWRAFDFKHTRTFFSNCSRTFFSQSYSRTVQNSTETTDVWIASLLRIWNDVYMCIYIYSISYVSIQRLQDTLDVSK